MSREGQFFLYAHPSMISLARRFFCPIHSIERERFPGGMPNICIDDMEQIQNVRGGANIVYFSQFSTLEEYAVEKMIIFVLADTPNVASLTIVNLYDPFATMERVTKEGVIATSNVDAHFWKTLPILDRGRKVTRILYDHHTLQNRFYFSAGNTTVVFRSALKSLVKQVVGITCVAFPDEGAYKRFSPFFTEMGCDTIVCGKQRDGASRRVVIKEGNPTGKHVVIVDDLVRSGGTLLSCANVLSAAKAQTVSVFVTHADFDNSACWERFQDSIVDTFYVSNTIPRVTNQLENVKPFRVIDIFEDLYNVIGTIF